MAMNPTQVEKYIEQLETSAFRAIDNVRDERAGEAVDVLVEALSEYTDDDEPTELKERTALEATDFMGHLITSGFQIPIVSAMSDGAIVFQWSEKGRGVLTLSFYGDGVVSYAARFGSKSRSRGTTELYSHDVPEQIAFWLRKFFVDEDSKWIDPASKKTRDGSERKLDPRLEWHPC